MNKKKAFIHTFREAVLHADIPPAHKLILICLSLKGDEHGAKAFPSHAAIGKECGVSTRTARRQVAHLVAEKWLEIVVRGCSGDGMRGRRANQYQLHVGSDFRSFRDGTRPVGAAPDDYETAQKSAAPEEKPKPDVKEKVKLFTPEVALVESSTGEPEVEPEEAFDGLGIGATVDEIADF